MSKHVQIQIRNFLKSRIRKKNSSHLQYSMACVCTNRLIHVHYTVHMYTGKMKSRIQEAKYVEGWPNTTSAWAGWSRFDIPVDRYGGVHSLLICTSSTLGSHPCHRASQQDNTYWTKYQKADRASTLGTLWVGSWVLLPGRTLQIWCQRADQIVRKQSADL